MYRDLLGKNRMKISLHMHTTNSDGRKSPEEAVAIYQAAGYDVMALTDHWKYTPSGTLAGMRILSGAEYNTPGRNGGVDVYHILALGCQAAPNLSKDASAEEIVDEILRCEGLPVLAHPAWSLNTPEQGLDLHGCEAIEIYNSVSDAHMSSRPYSGYFADVCAAKGKPFLLLAADDVHYYDGTDEAKAWIMVECDPDATDSEILEAIKSRRFYATHGPELHVWREGNTIHVRCSPVSRISMFSNAPWSPEACVRGENLTGHTYELQPHQTFVRAEVTDAEGRCAWSNIIDLR